MPIKREQTPHPGDFAASLACCDTQAELDTPPAPGGPAAAWVSDPRSIERWRASFTQIDTDGSGDISADELAEFMAAKHDMSRADADNLFKSMDTDGDGNITLQEFGDGLQLYEVACKIQAAIRKKQAAQKSAEVAAPAAAAAAPAAVAAAAQFKAPPGLAMKVCCPCCAVYFHEGAGGPCCLACVFECCYTVLCWKPKQIPVGGAPIAPDMQVMDRA